MFDAIELFEASKERIGLCLFGYSYNCFSMSEEGNEVEKNGCDLIEYLEAHIPVDKYPCFAIIHSHDIHSEDMVNRLRKLNIYTQYRPFSSDMIRRLARELVRQ